MPDIPPVIDDEAAHRLTVPLDEGVAELVYRRRDDRLVLTHTEVPEALEGRGIGGALVRAAVAKATAEGLTLVPSCPFARRWLEGHPDEAAAVAIDWPEA